MATCGSVLTLSDRIFAGCVKAAVTNEVVIKGDEIRIRLDCGISVTAIQMRNLFSVSPEVLIELSGTTFKYNKITSTYLSRIVREGPAIFLFVVHSRSLRIV